ncbi:hypothetical protein SDC9_118669 [bioreactor metagenome]|uniref:DUF4209 domain-containing protein n=1 Tax=bioreactor metagenome TaxID=1076179 RepID=A0A645C254_9ZZZZ
MPSDLSEANRLALKYCRKDNLNQLFTLLRKNKIRKLDLEEAIFCFQNKKYKSCALVLFSLIDSELIKKQDITNVKRKVGGSAIDKFKKSIKTTNILNELDMLLNFNNLITCLFEVFSDSEDFKANKKIVNRNYISHGMTSKPVRRRDCIQLFLLLYNLLNFIDIVFEY